MTERYGGRAPMNRGATIVFAPIWLVPARIPGSAGRQIAPLCNRLQHAEDCLGKARARQWPLQRIWRMGYRANH